MTQYNTEVQRHDLDIVEPVPSVPYPSLVSAVLDASDASQAYLEMNFSTEIHCPGVRPGHITLSLGESQVVLKNNSARILECSLNRLILELSPVVALVGETATAPSFSGGLLSSSHLNTRVAPAVLARDQFPQGLLAQWSFDNEDHALDRSGNGYRLHAVPESTTQKSTFGGALYRGGGKEGASLGLPSLWAFLDPKEAGFGLKEEVDGRREQAVGSSGDRRTDR